MGNKMWIVKIRVKEGNFYRFMDLTFNKEKDTQDFVEAAGKANDTTVQSVTETTLH